MLTALLIIVILIIVGLVAIAFLAIAIYNALVSQRNYVSEGWSGIDVQLRRRFNLVGNLVSTVKGYAKHEAETLAEVTKMRTDVRSDDPVARAAAENKVSGALANLFAVPENYPDLKADGNFLELQRELSALEDGAPVPAGRYRLVKATLGLGDARVVANTRRMGALRVRADETTSMVWGAPLKASFVIGSKDGALMLDPEKVRYVGAGGEVWTGWDPIGKSPSFKVKDKETGDVLVDVVFPGSC